MTQSIPSCIAAMSPDTGSTESANHSWGYWARFSRVDFWSKPY